MHNNSEVNIEIEKKYIIAMPDVSELEDSEGYSCSEILQIYLPSSDGSTHRVRKRVTDGVAVYTETRKIRIDRMSSTEIEGEIGSERFEELAAAPLENTSPIRKVRHVFFYLGQKFEIDIYPQWKDTAILETELDSREREVVFPRFIKILRDVTGDRQYSNAGMSRAFPKEDALV